MRQEIYFLRFIHQKSFFFLTIGVVASVFYGGIDACLVRMVKHLLDEGFVNKNSTFLQTLPLLLASFFIIRSVSGFFSQYFMARSSVNTIAFIRKDLTARLLKYPSHVYDQHTSGELMNRIVYITHMLGHLTSDFFAILIREGVTIIGLITVMFLSSVPFTLIYLTSLPFMMFVLSRVGVKARKNNSNVNQRTELLSTHVQQLIHSEKVVKSFMTQDHEHQSFSQIVSDTSLFESKQFKVVAFGAAVVQFIGGVALSLIIYLSLSSNYMSVTAGEFTCLVTAILALLRPIKQVTKLNADWQKIMSYCMQLREMYQWPLEIDNSTLQTEEIKGSICFENVSFKYSNSSEQQILSNISFQVSPGSKVAIIGPSGGGKSTLISLLPRFYEPTSGKITIDGYPIEEFSLKQLRENISIVGQDIRLIRGSILSNIAYGDDEPNLEKACKAANLAYAHDFIISLDNGYETVIGENGQGLSGGQKQRLALARSFYKQAPIIILDEATSALDHESEDKVQIALDTLMKDRTTLVIAHRLKTIINADLIIVIDQGRIIEAGSHDKLLKNKGFYFHMYRESRLYGSTSLEDKDTLPAF